MHSRRFPLLYTFNEEHIVCCYRQFGTPSSNLTRLSLYAANVQSQSITPRVRIAFFDLLMSQGTMPRLFGSTLCRASPRCVL